MSISMKSTKHFGFEPTPAAMKGPKGDTDFLRSNYKYMAVGSIFRTPRAKFSHAQVHAGAKRAGAIVEIVEEGPWLRVKMIGKIPPARLTRKSPDPPNVYFGAGKEYPLVDERPTAPEPGTYIQTARQAREKNKKRKKIKKKAAPPVPLGGYVKNWRSLQKTATTPTPTPAPTSDIDIFS